MSFAIQGKITGLDDVFKRLKALPAKVQKQVLRPALMKATKPVLTAARAKCPVRTGGHRLLKKSLGRRVKTYRRSGSLVVVIGPRTGFKEQTGTKRDGTPIYEDPANIAHLVEYGHGGRSPAPPHPFMRPAWDETKAQVEAILKSEILAGIEREAAK